MINILFYIAEADGHISETELNMIEHIAQIFGLSSSQLIQLKKVEKIQIN